MNNPAQGGQPAPSAAQQQARRGQIPMFKPEQMRGLPDTFSNEKGKWEAGLRGLWDTLEGNAPDTPQHLEAKRKIFEFSKSLTGKMQAYRMQKAGENAAGRPDSQGGPAQGGESSAPKPNPEQARPQPSRVVPPKLMEHVQNFPFVLPPTHVANSAEAKQWLAEARNRYLKGLVAMDGANTRLTTMEAMVQKRVSDGKPLNLDEERDYKEKKEQYQKSHAEAKLFVDNFRNQQQQAKAAKDAREAREAGNANAGQGSPTQQQPGGNNGPVRPQMSAIQQPANPTQTVNAAIEAARNQQMGGPRPPNGQMSQPGQVPTPTTTSMPGPNIKQEAGIPPQINTAISQMQQRQGMQNSPQSAAPQSGIPQSATSQGGQPPGPPRALTHSAALSQAARSYSSGGPQPSSSTPHVMGHSHPSATPREVGNINSNKMPIPKQLHERAQIPPQPVSMGAARPTYSGGPTGAGNGVMSQPVLPKTPGYNMASDDNRVLSRKKLDELVKQVTGGGQGDGPSLMPEVEESMLTVADTFVDQVLHNACKMAKERGSKVLEIRDIQLTLERNYNIRIPGYASDEIRTVRKIQPAPAWIAKMSAVQAAKVTGGKNAD